MRWLLLSVILLMTCHKESLPVYTLYGDNRVNQEKKVLFGIKKVGEEGDFDWYEIPPLNKLLIGEFEEGNYYYDISLKYYDWRYGWTIKDLEDGTRPLFKNMLFIVTYLGNSVYEVTWK